MQGILDEFNPEIIFPALANVILTSNYFCRRFCKATNSTGAN